MPYIRMKRFFLQGLLWLYLLFEFGYMALSLEPGFLDFDNLPDTNFSCLGKVIGGYYADLETNCQMFHVCTIGQLDEPMDIRFLCLNGTVFDQETRVCERIDEVDCSKSERFYGLNLELYGNTQPPILEDSPETEQPLIIKSTTTTTSTTTPKPKATNTPFYSSSKPSTVSTQTVTPHHFSLGNSPDIRFNPEEINISLHPGAPPDIRTKPVTYQQQSYSDNNKKVVLTTHSDNSDSKKVSVTTHSQVFDLGKVLPGEDFLERPQTQKPRLSGFGDLHSNKNFQHPTPSDINFEFTFRQTEPSRPDFHTELPNFFHSDFHSDQDYAGHHHNPQSQQFKSSTFHDDYTPTTKGANNFQQKIPTTVRNYFIQNLKPPAPNQPHHYSQHQTEKPQRLQLPLPLLPTLPPLTFSSPAPFALQHHIDTKRYTKDHTSPPRIVISASASVSDATGRRLNYSLGTIGAAEFLEQPPHSYDEYKDEDVGLDPFFHDVPKLKRSRSKRDAIKHSDIIKSEEEAVNVLKFLFDWYKNNERTATESTTLPTVVTENVQKTEESAETDFKNSKLFDGKSKFNIIGNGDKEKKQNNTNTTTKRQVKTTTAKTTTTTQISKYEKDFFEEVFGSDQDYVNDNFEPIAYKEKYEEKGKTGSKPAEEIINTTLPKDYVDDNIEPIYFKDRTETEKEIEEKKVDKKEGIKTPLDEKNKEFEYVSSSISPPLSTEVEEEVKESPIEIGDTETNKIKQSAQEEETKIETSTKIPERAGFSEPKSEILETVTTEKATVPIKLKNNQRRGRKRYHNSTDKEKEKEPEPKKMVLEKITERAHTAKDDFNYLRTLYKVYTTTPTYNVSETKSLEDIGGTAKTRKVFNDYTDTKEASPSDKVIQTFTEKEEEVSPGPPDLIPIVTTEITTTTEKTTPSETTLLSTSTTTEPTSSSTTTETVTPSSDTVTEYVVSLTTVKETTTKSSTSTTEKVLVPSSVIEETAPPLTTVTEKILSSSTTISETIVSPTETVSSSVSGEVTVPATTTTTESSEPSSRRDSRRRGRTRFGNGSVKNTSNNRRRKPEESRTTTLKPELSVSDLVSSSSTTENNVVQRNDYADDVVEEKSSNINRNIIPYPVITTEYTPTVPNNILLSGVTEQTEFLTQLTLNYKKIFEDISQTSGPVSPQVLEVSNLPVTEVNPSSLSSVFEDAEVVSTSPKTVTTTTTTTEKVMETTPKSEVVETSHHQLKSESQVLQSEETTTAGRIEKETESFITAETGGSSETLPTTLLFTERPTNEEEVQKISNQFVTEITSTEKMLQETIPVENTPPISSTTENSYIQQETSSQPTEKLSTSSTIENNDPQEKSLVTTEKSVEEARHDHNVTPELTTTNLPREETYQTTPIPLRDNTLLIPKITEIFNFHDIVKEKDFFGIPTTLLTTERPVQFRDVTDAIVNHSENTREDSTTESYPNTIYVLRTTGKSQSEREEETKLKTDEQTTYPSTVLVIRTTENPKASQSNAEEKLSTIRQLSTEGLHKLIEEIEENTKSVVATTNLPTIKTTPGNSIPHDGKINQEATTEKRADLEDLINLFQHATKSSYVTTTPTEVLLTPKEEVTESTRELSTTEESRTAPTIDADLMSTSQIERLTISEKPLTTTVPTTTTSSRRRGNIRRGERPARRRNPETGRRSTIRHRFSTDSFTRRPEGHRQTIEEEIIDELTKGSTGGATTEPYRRRLRVRPSNGGRKSSTDAPLQKSASPTQPERARESLPTTPLSKDGAKRHFIFNCFGKDVDRFYPDPRDCRLFHYCTQGYNKNQLIDMKFVCDLNTYFDDVKLICSKKRPRRCV